MRINNKRMKKMQAINKMKKQKQSSSRNIAESNPSCSNDDRPDSNSDSLFDRIYSATIHPKMPNLAWAIHRHSFPNRTIVASELGAPGENNVEIVAPLYIKQIVFDSKLNFEVFFMNTRTVLKDKPIVPRTLEEFQQVVAFIDEIKLCAGGPGVEEYGNVDLECAYKDPTEKWRHNLCTLETVDQSVCKSCFSLQEILQRHVQRNRLSGRNLPYSRKEKRKVSGRRAKRI